MSNFTELEQTVLDVICKSQPTLAEQLPGLLARARVAERENTGHGFYTSFEVEPEAAPVEWPTRIVAGPDAEVLVGTRTLLMGFVLWLEGGRPSCLEGFQHGTPGGDDVDLKSFDLATLRWLGPRTPETA